MCHTQDQKVCQRQADIDSAAAGSHVASGTLEVDPVEVGPKAHVVGVAGPGRVIWVVAR